MTKLQSRNVNVASSSHVVGRSVYKEYRAGSEKMLAVQDVSFVLGKGEFVSIIGPSGCGKSTLLKMILGVVPPSSGVIEVEGKAVTGPRRDVGMVFQTPALLPWRRVVGNVLLPIDALSLNRAEYLERASDLLRMVGLEGFETRYPNELSGGMQQRVSICRALVYDPSILLMDEPFGALDAMTREVMQTEILKIWRRTRKTILLVTHSIDEAVLLSDRVICMSARPGRIIQEVEIDIPERAEGGDPRQHQRFHEITRMLRSTMDLNQLQTISSVEDSTAGHI